MPLRPADVAADVPLSEPIIPDCPECPGMRLDLKQPDEQQPLRVLGYCASCGRVYFVRPDGETGRADEWPEAHPWKVIGPAGLALAG